MKVAIGYPPIEHEKGVALLSQNRQFQYFNAPTYIYPMVPAYAASLAKSRGYDVVWLDGIAERWVYSEWLEGLKKEAPDLLMLETKAPVLKRHWKIIDELKREFPKMKIAIVGDHVTWNPQETLDACLVDYIIPGGYYDFLLSELLDSMSSGNVPERGVYGDKTRKDFDLDTLPFIDRDLTKWKLYAFENGNYKFTPGTYMYSGRDCWWGRCTFCIWDHTLNPPGSYKCFSPERLFEEVKHVVDNYGVKEIFDDAGTMFVGPRLKKFCELLIESGYNKKVVFSCNMRLNALNQEYYDLMAKANFRFLLYGMESGNQETLDRIDKGLKVEQIEEGVEMAKKAGLEPHITVMLGYPWESEKMALKTISLAKELFKKGYVDTMQATIVIPYPGAPLYQEALEKDWFQVDPKNYEAFDMRGPVLEVPFSNERLHELTQELYSAFFTPQFIIRKILSIRSLNDIKFLIMAAKRLISHLLDFDKSQGGAKFFSPKFWKSVIKSLFISKHGEI